MKKPVLYILILSVLLLQGCGGIENYSADDESEKDVSRAMTEADIEWAQSNAPLFNVSTPEQLAGVVYYVNTSSDTSDYTIHLENDIDLSGYE